MKTEVADDIKQAMEKEVNKKKKFTGELFAIDENSKGIEKKDVKKKLLDGMEVWNEDEMERMGYYVEAKGLYRGLKVNDEDEFPDLGVNIGLPDIDSPSYKKKMKELEMMKEKEEEEEIKEMKVDIDIEEEEEEIQQDLEVDLVQELATEDNLQQLMAEEYNEEKHESQNTLGFNEFNKILDSHINEMEAKKKYGKENIDDALDTTASNKKMKKANNDEKKGNKQEREFDNMLQNMMGGALSDDEDDSNLGETQLIHTSKPQKAINNMLGDTMEMVTKFKKGTEYESQTYTSSAGGKLIINSIKKHYSKKNKRGKNKRKASEENKENKAVIPIKEEINEHIDLEEGDEIEEVEVVEELADEEGEYFDENDDGNWSNENYDDNDEKEDEEDEYSEDDSYSELPKLERQEKKDAKRPDYIDGMKVLKVEYTPQLTFEEDIAAQNMVNPDREEPESGDEDYAMGTTNRIKVKGQVL